MSVQNMSSEDYLEAILMLSKKLPVVRSVDVASELGFKKPSVSVAMKNLRERELITVTSQGYIYLTDAGKKIAEYVYEKHVWFTNWLVSLGVSEAQASIDACMMEHAISEESFLAIKKAIPNS